MFEYKISFGKDLFGGRWWKAFEKQKIGFFYLWKYVDETKSTSKELSKSRLSQILKNRRDYETQKNDVYFKKGEIG